MNVIYQREKIKYFSDKSKIIRFKNKESGICIAKLEEDKYLIRFWRIGSWVKVNSYINNNYTLNIFHS